MSGFVKRLRTLDGLRCPTTRELEAADRIEALEAALREINEAPDWCWINDARRIAHAALAPAATGPTVDPRCEEHGCQWHLYKSRYDVIEECARLVESTGLRNPDNIARDIRALAQKD